MHARVSGQSGGHLAPSDLAAITRALKISRDKRLKSFGVISRVKRERRHISLLGDQLQTHVIVHLVYLARQDHNTHAGRDTTIVVVRSKFQGTAVFVTSSVAGGRYM